MEVRVRERLVGALVLVGIVVLLVPAILTGGPDREPQAQPGVTTQSVEIRIADDTPATETDVLMPEPAQASTGAEKSGAVPKPTPTPEQEPQAAAPAPASGPIRGPEPTATRNTAPPEPQPAAATSGPVPERPAWAVQLGAFSTREKAESLVADLRTRGYAAFVLEYRASGRVLHRVRVGPEQDRSRADAVAERLRKDGYPTVVAPHP